MIVKESDYKLSPQEKLMNSIDFVSESVYDSCSANSVIIRYNDRFDKDLIQLESFCEYANTHGIEDAGIAIANVCEANNVAPTNLGFYVSEANCYADDSLMEATKLFMENGYQVYLAPISTGSLYYRQLDEALELDEQYSDYEASEHLRAYCEEDEESLFGNDFKDIASKYTAAKQQMKELSPQISRASGEAKANLIAKYNKLKTAAAQLKAKIKSKKNQ